MIKLPVRWDKNTNGHMRLIDASGATIFADDVNSDIAYLLSEVDRLTSERDAMRDMLRKHAYRNDYDSTGNKYKRQVCVECLTPTGFPHAPDCELAKLIK